MCKYRKKPVVVEAFQMTEERRWDNSEWPEWLNAAWNKGAREGGLWIDPDDPKREKLVCGTLEGVYRINWNDWIIQGIQGEIYPCKPDIFEVTYESIEQQQFTFADVELNQLFINCYGCLCQKHTEQSYNVIVDVRGRLCCQSIIFAYASDLIKEMLDVDKITDAVLKRLGELFLW